MSGALCFIFLKKNLQWSQKGAIISACSRDVSLIIFVAVMMLMHRHIISSWHRLRCNHFRAFCVVSGAFERHTWHYKLIICHFLFDRCLNQKWQVDTSNQVVEYEVKSFKIKKKNSIQFAWLVCVDEPSGELWWWCYFSRTTPSEREKLLILWGSPCFGC